MWIVTQVVLYLAVRGGRVSPVIESSLSRSRCSCCSQNAGRRQTHIRPVLISRACLFENLQTSGEDLSKEVTDTTDKKVGSWETKLTFLTIGSDGGHLDLRVVIKELSNIADESERHWPKGFRKCPRCYWARHRKGGRAIILWIKISAPCTGALSRIRIAVCAVQYHKVCSNEL